MAMSQLSSSDYLIPPIYPSGHLFVYGKTGEGKTWLCYSLMNYYYEKGHKIWALWGGKRKENHFISLPNNDYDAWLSYMAVVGEMEEPGPKEYPVKFAFPFFSEYMEGAKLPEKRPRVIAEPFTLFFKDIKIDNIATVTGHLSKTDKRIWKNIKEMLPDNANGADILNWFEDDDRKKHKSTNIFQTFIKPLCENHLLQGKACQHNLNLKAEAEDKSSIFILADDYTPEDFKMFFISYIMNNLYQMAEDDVIHRDNMALFQELNYFMKVQDDSEGAEQKKSMASQFSDIGRYGRTAFRIIGNTQSPYEVGGLVEGQEDFLAFKYMVSPKDREKACQHLVDSGLMHPDYVKYIGSEYMEKPCVVVVQEGKKAQVYKRFQPPRNRTQNQKDGSFLTVWKNEVNEWRMDISEIAEHLENLYGSRRYITYSKKESSEPNIEDEEDESEDDSFEESEESQEEDKQDDKEKEEIPLHQGVGVSQNSYEEFHSEETKNSQDLKSKETSETVDNKEKPKVTKSEESDEKKHFNALLEEMKRKQNERTPI